MNRVEIENLIKYWLETSKRDFDTMNGLFKIKRYPESLFYGHIMLEKILKGLVTSVIEKQAPFSHDLVVLAELARLNLSEQEMLFLKSINGFNIRARYPDQKFKIYNLCDRNFTKENLDKIVKLYNELCQRLMQKK